MSKNNHAVNIPRELIHSTAARFNIERAEAFSLIAAYFDDYDTVEKLLETIFSNSGFEATDESKATVDAIIGKRAL